MAEKRTEAQQNKRLSDDKSRKPYRRPALVEYGNLRDLTAGAIVDTPDTGGGSGKF